MMFRGFLTATALCIGLSAGGALAQLIPSGPATNPQQYHNQYMQDGVTVPDSVADLAQNSFNQLIQIIVDLNNARAENYDNQANAQFIAGAAGALEEAADKVEDMTTGRAVAIAQELAFEAIDRKFSCDPKKAKRLKKQVKDAADKLKKTGGGAASRVATVCGCFSKLAQCGDHVFASLIDYQTAQIKDLEYKQGQWKDIVDKHAKQ